MSSEEDRLEAIQTYYAESMTNFLKIPPEGGVNNFIISGPAIDQPIHFKTLVGLYGRAGETPPDVAVIGLETPPIKAMELYKRIEGLSVPERVKKLGVPPDPDLEDAFKEICSSAELPYAVLAIGRAENSDEVIMLTSIWGAEPTKILGEFQQKAKQRLREFQ
jgi:hypothetical protein